MIPHKIYCGIEIETEYNVSKLNLEIGEYHTSCISDYYFGHYFHVENDGSLYTSHKFKYGSMAEFVSAPFDINDWEKVIDDFKNSVIEDSGTNKLDDVLYFNNSCGAHIHISVLTIREGMKKIVGDRVKVTAENCGDYVPFKIVSHRALLKINRRILKDIKREMPNVYESISKRFYRGHASEEIDEYDKYSTWNYRPKEQGRLEFRSFNLSGVENWTDFKKIYGIVFHAIKAEFAILMRKKLVSTHNQKISCFGTKYDNDLDYEVKPLKYDDLSQGFEVVINVQHKFDL